MDKLTLSSFSWGIFVMKKNFSSKVTFFYRSSAAVCLFGGAKLQPTNIDLARHNLQNEVLKGGSSNRTVMVVFFLNKKKSLYKRRESVNK